MKESNSRRWLGIALMFVLVAGGGYFAIGSGETTDTQVGLQREDGLGPGAESSAEGKASLVSLGENVEQSTGKREAVEELSVDEQKSFSPKARGKSVIWIEGRVESPEDVPLDETMEVVAKGKVFKGTKGRREHRVQVKVDGTFKVAVSADTAAARLSLVAKYQYMKDPVVWIKSDGGEAVLKPQLGARMMVDVVTEPFSQEDLVDFSASLIGMWNWDGDTKLELQEGNRLELKGLPTGRECIVISKAKGYAHYRLVLTDLEGGKTTEGTVILKPEAIAIGRLVDNRGEPVPEGKVTPRIPGKNRWESNMEGTGLAEVVDGKFEVRGLSAGDIELHFTGSGYSAEPLIVPNLRVGETREGLVWHANKGLSVKGKVIWPDGGPARHVSVKLVGMSRFELAEILNSSGGMGGTMGTKVETDADGLFEISGFSKAAHIELMAEGLPPDKPVPRDLSKIQKRRFRRKHTVRARVDRVLVGGPELSLLLGEEQDPLRGRVEDDRGEPISTFRLTATPVKGKKKPQGGGMMWGAGTGGTLRQRYKDEDGAFVWAGIPSGDWSIEATASGYQKGELQPVTTPSSKEVVFMLPRGARIFGKVVGNDDEKVLAEVHYVQIIDGEVSGEKGSVAATKQLGFSINNLAPGTYRMTAREPVSGQSPEQTFQVAAGEIVKDVILKVPGPGSLTGTVHRDWWSDQLEVQLRPARGEGAYWKMHHLATVRADGTFSVDELAPGDYTARLNGSFKVGPEHSVSADPGQSRNVTIASGQASSLHFDGAPAGSVRLKGRLLRDGEGVSGYKIELTGIEPKRPEVECISRAGGAYSAILAGPGTYRVQAHPADHGPAQVWQIEVGAGSQTMDLNLPSYSLTVVLSAQEGGVLPFDLKRSSLSLRVKGMGRRGKIEAKSMKDNEVLFTGLAAGSYDLKFEPGGRGWGQKNASDSSPWKWVLADNSEIILAADSTQTTVRRDMRLGASLTGRLTGARPDTSRFLYVRLTLKEAGGDNHWAQIEDGEFSFSGLAAGDVWVACKGSGVDEAEPVKVTISYENSAFVEIPYPTVSVE